MTVVVTGGAGFVACTLIARLLERGETVVAIDNLSRGSKSNLQKFLAHPRFSFVELDLHELSQVCDQFKRQSELSPIREVWHLAANSDIPAGVSDPRIDLRDTFMTTFCVLLAMQEVDCRRLMFASSSAIYGDHGDLEITEDAGPLFPISNYGAMKLASEAQITAASESFLEQALIFRFPNVVGVPATHGVLLDFLQKLRADPATLQVLGNGSQKKSYLHVSDLVDAMLHIAKDCRERRDAFNIGPVDDGITVRQIANEVVSVVSPRAELRFGVEDRGWVGDVPRFRYSIEKLLALGWRPRLSSLEAVRMAIGEIVVQEEIACLKQ